MNKMLMESLRVLLGTSELPTVFAKGKVKALKIGVFEDFRAAYPNVDAAAISAFLGVWTSRAAYLQKVSRGKYRYNLDGEEVSGITECERRHARSLLAAQASYAVSVRAFASRQEIEHWRLLGFPDNSSFYRRLRAADACQ